MHKLGHQKHNKCIKKIIKKIYFLSCVFSCDVEVSVSGHLALSLAEAFNNSDCMSGAVVKLCRLNMGQNTHCSGIALIMMGRLKILIYGGEYTQEHQANLLYSTTEGVKNQRERKCRFVSAAAICRLSLLNITAFL